MNESFESSEKSPLQQAYEMLGVSSMRELSRAYTEEDQRLMKTNEWDYKNPELLTNKIKDLLEQVNESDLSEEEKEWRGEILWFWYHHAISCAVARYRDQKEAQEFALKALEYQSEDHPNQITKLLKHLVFGELELAEQLAEKIEIDYEKETAKELIEDYKEGKFFSE